MEKISKSVRRFGLLILPLIVVGIGLETQIYIYQRFNYFVVPDVSLIHLFYLSFGPFVYFFKSEKMRFRQVFSVWKRVYWVLFGALAAFYLLAVVAAYVS